MEANGCSQHTATASVKNQASNPNSTQWARTRGLGCRRKRPPAGGSLHSTLRVSPGGRETRAQWATCRGSPVACACRVWRARANAPRRPQCPTPQEGMPCSAIPKSTCSATRQRTPRTRHSDVPLQAQGEGCTASLQQHEILGVGHVSPQGDQGRAEADFASPRRTVSHGTARPGGVPLIPCGWLGAGWGAPILVSGKLSFRGRTESA